MLGSARPGTPEWKKEQEMIHEVSNHAAGSIQKHVRGSQARAKTPPIHLEAQASAELSADLEHAEKEGIPHHHVVSMYASEKTTAAAIKTKKQNTTTKSVPRYTTKKAAGIALQKTMRGHIAKDQVRLKRGEVAWNNMSMDQRPSHGWIAIKDPRHKKYYYYQNELSEYRWVKPSPIVYRPVHNLHDAISGLAAKVDIASGIALYAMHGPSYDAIGLAQNTCKSALNKCKALFAQERSCRSFFVDDMESVEAGVEMLEEARQMCTEAVEDDLMATLITAQSDILENMSQMCERVGIDLERHMRSGLLSRLGTQPGDPNIAAMQKECKRAIGHVVGWWEKVMLDVPEDTRIYLQMVGWDGASRSDWYPMHAAVESCNTRCTLLRDCMSQCVMDAQRAGEVQRESEELEAMRLEEISLRTHLRKTRGKAEEWAKRESELTKLRSAWRYGLYQRKKEEQENAKQLKALKLAKELMRTERLAERRLEQKQMGSLFIDGTGNRQATTTSRTKSHLAKYNNSPWYGVERGCSRYELEELIAEERARRTHQEKRTIPFHVDDPEHDTGKRLLHQACFWRHGDLVEYLLARGANPIGKDSVVTKFTPLDEGARGGSPIVVRHVLNSCGQKGLFIKNIHGDTPIHTAARGGRSQALSEMIEFCKGKLGPDGGGTADAADDVFQLIDCVNGKMRTPLQLTTNEGVKEVLLAASEWAIDARANQGVFGMGSSKKGRMMRNGKSGAPNTMGKWLQELNPNAY